MVRLMGRGWGGGTTLLYHAGVLGSTPRGCTHHVMCECVVCVACRAVPPPEETACIAPSPDRLAESSAARQRLQTLIGPRVPMHCMRGYGATAARLTPDQKVGSSNLSSLILCRRGLGSNLAQHRWRRVHIPEVGLKPTFFSLGGGRLIH